MYIQLIDNDNHHHDNDYGEGLVSLKGRVQILSIFIVEVPIG